MLLSTTSVYPESTESSFEIAAHLGYDGVELMVGIDPVTYDIDAIEKMRDYHQVSVDSVHAPCLIVTQTSAWGDDPWQKLESSSEAALRLGADAIVVHPPFVWQRGYAKGFEAGIRRLNDSAGVTFCVENMFPWRTPAGDFKAYRPGWDPSELDYDALTLDLSHAATSRVQALDLAKAWGPRLRHVHLTDGSGLTLKDEHLLPGDGNQHADQVLRYLADTGFHGHVVLEVNTRGSGSRSQREADLARALEFTREHLGQAPQALVPADPQLPAA